MSFEANRPPDLPLLCIWGRIGALAQLARAPALQAGGQEFESLMLHHIRNRQCGRFFVFAIIFYVAN